MSRHKNVWIFFDKKMFWENDKSEFIKTYITLTALHRSEEVIKYGKKITLQSLRLNLKNRTFENQDCKITEVEVKRKK